jgi:hypothetical protein
MPKPVKTPLQQVLKVQGDEKGGILNGWPTVPYLPGDPGRRKRYLAVLGISDTDLLTRED